MKRSGMTLIEMVVCLAIVGICLVALVRGVGSLSFLAARDHDDAVLLPQVEHLLATLEHAPSQEMSGTLEGGWRYETEIRDDAYILHVVHDTWSEQHDVLIREGPV